MEIKYVKGLDRIFKTDMVQSSFLDMFFLASSSIHGYGGVACLSVFNIIFSTFHIDLPCCQWIRKIFKYNTWWSAKCYSINSACKVLTSDQTKEELMSHPIPQLIH